MRTFQPRTEAERRLAVWTFMVAIDSHRNGAGGAELTDEGIALFERFLYTFADICAFGWEGVQAVLNEFFWTRELAKFWDQSWDRLTGNM